MRGKNRLKKLEREANLRKQGSGTAVVCQDFDNPDLFHHKESGRVVNRQALDDLRSELGVAVLYRIEYVDDWGNLQRGEP